MNSEPKPNPDHPDLYAPWEAVQTLFRRLADALSAFADAFSHEFMNPANPAGIGLAKRLDTFPNTCHTPKRWGTDPDAATNHGVANMPRRRNRQSCECGCGQMTETGRFLRGHATRHRWNLIKAAELGQGMTSDTDGIRTADEVKRELETRHWAMPSSRRTFGVEFELSSPVDAYRIADALEAAGITVETTGRYASLTAAAKWTIKTDSSIRRDAGHYGGYEVVSPPLRGKRGENMVRKVLKVLNQLGCTVNVSTGAHVHIGVADLWVQGIKNVVRAYTNSQRAINATMPRSRRNGHYCKTWNATELARLDNARDVMDLTWVADRYRTVNLKPYPRIGTVEFRQHGGTLNATKILAWVDFCRKLVEAAAKGQVGTEPGYMNLPTLLDTVRVPSASREYLLARAA